MVKLVASLMPLSRGPALFLKFNISPAMRRHLEDDEAGGTIADPAGRLRIATSSS